jgi:AcrR family transcriptional regulator
VFIRTVDASHTSLRSEWFFGKIKMASATKPQLDRTEPVANRTRDSSRASPSDTRARIIEAARQLFRRIGHKKTTVADIAREMSMSPANVYRFFPSKQAIEETVAGELFDQVMVAAFNAAHGEGSAIERLRAVLQAVEHWHKFTFDTDGKLYELVACAMHDNWAVAGAYVEGITSKLAHVVSGGQAAGELRQGDSMTFAGCILNAASSYLHPSVLQGCEKSARPTLNQMIDFCIGGLPAHRQHLAA